MLSLHTYIRYNISLLRNVHFHHIIRNISALYITGDKANENYVTLQPFMDFEKTLIEERSQLESSIEKRKLNINLDSLLRKYEKYKNDKDNLDKLEQQRSIVSQELKKLTAKVGCMI